MNAAAMEFLRPNIAVSTGSLLSVSIVPLGQGLAALESMGKSRKSGFSNSPHWVAHWAKKVNSDIAVVIAARNDLIIIALALEIVIKSGIKIAQFVGGNHANANFPAMATGLSKQEAETFLATLKNGLREKPWAVDAIMLERQLQELDGIENPLLINGCSISPNVSLHLSVDKNFDAVLGEHSGKRKRKRYRSQQRKFEAAGGLEIINPDARNNVETLLDEYFAMKAKQLRGKGVANVFGKPREQAFFKALLSDTALHHDHHFYLSSLRVGGKTRAIYGSSMHGTRQMVHFTAFAEDELTSASPGDFLNFSLIERACAMPTQTYDLGIGDEGYKRSWCNIETWHRDTVIGISLRGKLAKLQFDCTRSAKRWIKNNEKLWGFVKRVRKLKADKNVDPRQPNATEDGSEL